MASRMLRIYMIMQFFVFILNSAALAQRDENSSSPQPLERRVIMLEKAIDDMAKTIVIDGDKSLALQKRIVESIKEIKGKLESLEKEVSELKGQQADIDAMRSKIKSLEEKMLEFESSPRVSDRMTAYRNSPKQVRYTDSGMRPEGELAGSAQTGGLVTARKEMIREYARSGMVRQGNLRKAYDYSDRRAHEDSERIYVMDVRQRVPASECYPCPERNNPERGLGRPAVRAVLAVLVGCFTLLYYIQSQKS